MIMSLVKPSNLIGCGGDIEQSEPIRNKIGVQRGMEGCRGGTEGHGGVQRGCRGGRRGTEGVQRGM